ncbi:MAG TPA: low temperature requirement protein A [Chitinophagaceae bacterium]|nr:low temperature requirement protein A [Chitinophagaceae bacterium]
MSTQPINSWWGLPQNFSDRKVERKISWLELFYDLVYVAAIGQLTHHLATHPSWAAAGYSFLLFSLIFWSWVNGSQYYDLHGNDSVRTRLFTLLQMLAVAAVAVTVNDAFEGHHQSFAICFAIIEIVITYLWWSTGIWDPAHRRFSKFYTFNYMVAFVLLIVSVFTSYTTATVLWLVVLLFNLTPALTGARTITKGLKERGEVFSASAALVERFGLFAIIVLAESILAIVSSIAEVKDKHPVAWVAFILGIIITFLLWCLYFDMTSEQEVKKGYSHLQWLIFLHFPLLASFGIVGASIKVIIQETDTGEQLSVRWIFCVALAIILFMIVCIAAIMKEEEEDRAYIKPVSRLLLFTGMLLLIVPLFGHYLNALAFLCIITVLLFVSVFVGVRSWIKYKFFGRR